MSTPPPPGMPPQAVILACREAAIGAALAVVEIIAVDPADRVGTLRHLADARHQLVEAGRALDNALRDIVTWVNEPGDNPGHG
jgi:hypothetical protein